jgi:enoyl-CoA hydratase/carnithine racemase
VNLGKTVLPVICTSILLVSLASSARAQELIKDADRIRSADDFVRMLADHPGPFLDAVVAAKNAWLTALAAEQAAWLKLKEAVNSAARKEDIKSMVTFESLPTLGATVQFQSEDQRKGNVTPTTVGQKSQGCAGNAHRLLFYLGRPR